MTTITDVNSNFAIHRLKNWMPCVAFHVVRAFIEVPNAGNVVLTVFSDDLASMAHHHCCVPHGVTVQRVPLQNWANDDHGVQSGDFLADPHRITPLDGFSEFAPLPFSGAKGKGHVEGFLQAGDVGPGSSGSGEQFPDASVYGIALFCVGGGCGGANCVLEEGDAGDAGRAELFWGC